MGEVLTFGGGCFCLSSGLQPPHRPWPPNRRPNGAPASFPALTTAVLVRIHRSSHVFPTVSVEALLNSASFPGCYGFFCCPCLACTVSGMADANHCLPLCDIFSPAILTSCGVPISVPPALLSVRVATRQKYGIKVKDVRGRPQTSVNVS